MTPCDAIAERAAIRSHASFLASGGWIDQNTLRSKDRIGEASPSSPSLHPHPHTHNCHMLGRKPKNRTMMSQTNPNLYYSLLVLKHCACKVVRFRCPEPGFPKPCRIRRVQPPGPGRSSCGSCGGTAQRHREGPVALDAEPAALRCRGRAAQRCWGLAASRAVWRLFCFLWAPLWCCGPPTPDQ